MAFEGNECRECGKRIKPTGKRGRPAVRHAKCKALFEKREAKRKAERAKESEAPAAKPARKSTAAKKAAASKSSTKSKASGTKTRKAPARKRRTATASE